MMKTSLSPIPIGQGQLALVEEAKGTQFKKLFEVSDTVKMPDDAYRFDPASKLLIANTNRD
jgi:hypothetical protein